MLPVLKGAMGSGDRVGHDESLARLRAALTAEEFDREVQNGSRLSFAAAMSEVLPLLGESAAEGVEGAAGSPSRTAGTKRSLTAREREVLDCLAEGLANKDDCPASRRFPEDGHASLDRHLPKAGCPRPGRGGRDGRAGIDGAVMTSALRLLCSRARVS